MRDEARARERERERTLGCGKAARERSLERAETDGAWRGGVGADEQGERSANERACCSEGRGVESATHRSLRSTFQRRAGSSPPEPGGIGDAPAGTERERERAVAHPRARHEKQPWLAKDRTTIMSSSFWSLGTQVSRNAGGKQASKASVGRTSSRAPRRRVCSSLPLPAPHFVSLFMVARAPAARGRMGPGEVPRLTRAGASYLPSSTGLCVSVCVSRLRPFASLQELARRVSSSGFPRTPSRRVSYQPLGKPCISCAASPPPPALAFPAPASPSND